jgi:Cys-tRNA(Pro)/Cys-tRNA(Cys) deacylase
VHAKIAEDLRKHAVDYTVHRHDAFSEPIHSPADFAGVLGYELGRITKTLLVLSTTGSEYAMVVAPMGKKVDFRELANAMGVKRVEVAPAADLANVANVAGYPERGVSPIGVGGLPVFMDEELFNFATILVGAGEAGVEIEIAPGDLEAMTGAKRARLVRA